MTIDDCSAPPETGDDGTGDDGTGDDGTGDDGSGDDGTGDDGTEDDGTGDDGTGDDGTVDDGTGDDGSTTNIVEDSKSEEEVLDELDIFNHVTKEERMIVFDLPDDGKEHWQYGALGDVALLTYSVLGKNFFSDMLLLPVSSLGSFSDFFANL